MAKLNLIGALALAAACLGPASAQTPGMQTTGAAPSAETTSVRAYRGMILCEKMNVSPDILHVPFDLAVRGDVVQSARPIFNWNGRRIVGNELGWGSIDGDGKVRLTSQWSFRGQNYQTELAGMLTATGGTLSGKQSWEGREGPGSRDCNVALVIAPKAGQKAQRQ